MALLGGLYAAPESGLPPGGTGLRGCVYEHIQVSGDRLKVGGEHIMTEGGSLSLVEDFFGADEAITNFGPEKSSWVATLIFCGLDRHEACEKRNRSIAEIARRLELRDDPSPIS